MKKLSIIVPMYNVAPYVEKCIRSLEEQDIPKDEYEIICINDGSPDHSREIVMELQKEFNNINLIDQENQGVSRARNNGIDKAAGNYLLFIDPDDYVDQNSFNRVLSNAECHKAQVSFLGYTFIKEDGSIHRKIFNEKHVSNVFSGIDAYYLSRGDGRTDPDRMWAILFETKYINKNKLRYLPDVPYLEDGEFISRILCRAERCIFDGHSFYQRTTRPGSATNSTLFLSERANRGFLMAASNLKKFQQEEKLTKRQKEFLNQPICKFVVTVIYSASRPFQFKKIKDKRNQLSKSGLKKLSLKSMNIGYTLFGFFYNRSVFLLIAYFNILNVYMSIRIRIERLLFKV